MFVKYHQSDETKNLHKNMAANHLLSVISQRVSFKDNPVEGTKKGEAKLGDFEKIGMTRQQYRTALENLEKWGYITTRTTTKGILAKLVNNDVYEVFYLDNNHQDNQHPTIKQPTPNHQATNTQPSSNQHPTTIIDYKNIENIELENKENTPVSEISILKVERMWHQEIETYSTYTSLHPELKTAVKFYLDDQEEKEKKGITTSMVQATLLKVQRHLAKFDYKKVSVSLYEAVQKSNKDFNPAWNKPESTNQSTENGKVAVDWVMGKAKIQTGKV